MQPFFVNVPYFECTSEHKYDAFKRGIDAKQDVLIVSLSHYQS